MKQHQFFVLIGTLYAAPHAPVSAAIGAFVVFFILACIATWFEIKELK